MYVKRRGRTRLRPFSKFAVILSEPAGAINAPATKTKVITMKNQTLENDRTRQAVRERYGKIATAASGSAASCCAAPAQTVTAASSPTGCGCGTSGSTCCGEPGSGQSLTENLGYSATEAAAAPEGSNLGLGCGNPLAIASLRPGQTVLDLGSGAGFDAFLAARAVGSNGRVIGVDMTPEMVSKARANQAEAGLGQVEFRLGEIEHLPVADASVDVILSNCVINLSPDKPQVFREAFRVLQPGGRLALSDVVAFAEIPPELRGDWELYTGCVAGAASVSALTAMLADAGFAEIRIEPKSGSRKIVGQWFPGRRLEDFVTSATISAVKPAHH
jgi:SAM-dependent methyltransferase